jgi:hypothetical protein
MLGNYRIRMVRYCGKEGCNERSVAQVTSDEEFEGGKYYSDDIFGGRGYAIDLCQKHLNEL